MPWYTFLPSVKTISLHKAVLTSTKDRGRLLESVRIFRLKTLRKTCVAISPHWLWRYLEMSTMTSEDWRISRTLKLYPEYTVNVILPPQLFRWFRLSNFLLHRFKCPESWRLHSFFIRKSATTTHLLTFFIEKLQKNLHLRLSWLQLLSTFSNSQNTASCQPQLVTTFWVFNYSRNETEKYITLFFWSISFILAGREIFHVAFEAWHQPVFCVSFVFSRLEDVSASSSKIKFGSQNVEVIKKCCTLSFLKKRSSQRSCRERSGLSPA